MRRDGGLKAPADDDGKPTLPLRATGIVLGVWIAGMLSLTLVVVPALFAMCSGAPPP